MVAAPTNTAIFQRVVNIARPGIIIPKPESDDTRVKGVGKRRQEEAIIYTMPNHKGGKRYEKGVTASELVAAYKMLMSEGQFTRQWFIETFPKAYSQGPCNYTSLGGLLILLGAAEYADNGVYRVVE